MPAIIAKYEARIAELEKTAAKPPMVAKKG
jgi:hypothetical protein